MKLSVIQSIILGIVQGLTEFLPISSSGHLILTREVFKFPDPGKLFDLMLHFGTLVAIVIYFREDLKGVAVGFFEGVKNRRFFGEPRINMFWFLVISTIPGALFGVFFNDKLEEIKNVYLISALLIGFGILLLVSDRTGRKLKTMEALTWKDALIIGVLQAIALFPGVSRSGICMTGALFLGFNREASARYTFLISFPIIAGASFYGFYKILKSGPDGGALLIYAVGMVAAAVSGFFCIKFLIDYLKKGTFLGFTIYRVIVGILLIVLALLKII